MYNFLVNFYRNHHQKSRSNRPKRLLFLCYSQTKFCELSTDKNSYLFAIRHIFQPLANASANASKSKTCNFFIYYCLFNFQKNKQL